MGIIVTNGPTSKGSSHSIQPNDQKVTLPSKVVEDQSQKINMVVFVGLLFLGVIPGLIYYLYHRLQSNTPVTNEFQQQQEAQPKIEAIALQAEIKPQKKKKKVKAKPLEKTEEVTLTAPPPAKALPALDKFRSNPYLPNNRKELKKEAQAQGLQGIVEAVELLEKSDLTQLNFSVNSEI